MELIKCFFAIHCILSTFAGHNKKIVKIICFEINFYIYNFSNFNFYCKFLYPELKNVVTHWE